MIIKMEIANFFWQGTLTNYEYMCINSFVKNGFMVNVWSYQNDIALPPNCNLKNAEEILSIEHLTRYFYKGKEKSYLTTFSNVFRYNLLYKFPEQWWFDSDCICLKNQSFFKELRDNNSRIIAGRESKHHINGAVLCIQDQSITSGLIDMQKNLVETKMDSMSWGDLGPKLITIYLRENDLLSLAQQRKIFYPILSNHALLFNKDDNTEYIFHSIQDSYVCHLWNEMFKTFNINKNIDPVKDSFLDAMFGFFGKESDSVMSPQDDNA
jgi:hypothetical protein